MVELVALEMVVFSVFNKNIFAVTDGENSDSSFSEVLIVVFN